MSKPTRRSMKPGVARAVRKQQREEFVSYTWEVALDVACYRNLEVDGEDDDEAFDACASDTPSALKLAQDEVKEAKANVVIRKVEFVEFDSSNASHAGGIFSVTAEGSKAQIERLRVLVEES